MNILAVDDESGALRQLERAISQSCPGRTLYAVQTSDEALALAEEHPVDVAFLDICIDERNGLEVAGRLKEIRGDTNIIFVTGHDDYMRDAFRMHASGYLEKPVTAEDVALEMQNLRHVPVCREEKGLKVHTFGNFEVFMDGKPVHFARSKAKEVFAYLIHRQGAAVSVRELLGVLYEDRPYSYSLERQMQTYISSMMRTLKECGAGDCIIKRRNEISIDVRKVDCDYYRFLDWDAEAVNHYTGEYMTNYGWGEFVVGFLNSKLP